MSLDDLLEKSVHRIALRLSSVEDEFFALAGETLKKIYGLSNERIREYLYSDEYYSDISDDINKVKKALNKAHNANIKDLAALYDDITAAVYDEGADLAREKGEQLLPFTEFRKPFNPMLKEVVSGYKSMAKSTAVDQTYKKTISGMVNRLAGDEEHINYPQAMRKAIKELTEQGIAAIAYESGRKVRMDTAVRNALMTEYTEIIEGVQRKLAGEIGADGWEISAHEHCAVDHIDVQGHIFANEEFEKLQDHELAVDIEGEKFQLDRAIGDWNCRHIAYPFLIGISEPSFSKEQLEAIRTRNEVGIEFHGKHYTLYEAEQLQRKIENELRHSKGDRYLLRELRNVDPAIERDYQKNKQHIKDLNAEYEKLGKTLAPHAIRMKKERTVGIKIPFNNEITGQIYTKTDLLKAALAEEDKFHNTPLGRAFQSHNKNNTERRDSTYTGKNTANPQYNTEKGLDHLYKLFNSKDTEYKIDPDRTVYLKGGVEYKGIITIRLPNGEGARWTLDGKHFVGFRSRESK
jgi:hypothetical protein